SRIIEKPVAANLRLREEHIIVNRRPVNREVTDADLQNFREGELVITEHAEIPVVGKQARVVEEIVIGKNVTEHVETVHETVRRNEVEVEEINRDANDNNPEGIDINTRGATR
ncbi:MAG TPA: YsnF/AvaK domain-containing protein, partial [Pyrinomonadaceae bacterium]|nr:YsnF/AvaK domain-containing protein [Pyrinomonadaceae bacterium]